MMRLIPGIVSCCCLVILGCQDKPQSQSAPHFTRIDSVTENYLELKDEMLESWNRMISNDNQRLKALQNLLHELKVSRPGLRDDLTGYDERIRQLKEMRYTQKTMENGSVVEEYDFASSALLTELISLAESQPEFDYNSTLQKIIEKIRLADQDVIAYRERYDSVALQYNRFVEQHQSLVQDIEADSFVGKKPLFHMASEE